MTQPQDNSAVTESKEINKDDDIHFLKLVDSEYLSNPCETPLRICCYGSSSAATPEKYLIQARALGYSLARRGHTCVNGAGTYGCMAAMNDGASKGCGHIVGVIHEMFVVDGSDWEEGAHKVFHTENSDNKKGPTREILVAGGEDLQERKKLLVEGADGLVVLPGGPGTWDELWEMACARNIGLSDVPIVCVDVDGYYEPFRKMLERCFEEKMNKMKPDSVIHFEPTAELAVRWLEAQSKSKSEVAQRKALLKRRNSYARQSSFFSTPMGYLRRASSSIGFPSKRRRSSSRSFWSNGKLQVDDDNSSLSAKKMMSLAIAFMAGITLGASIAINMNKKN